MSDAADFERLLRAVKPIIDAHIETKVGSGLLDLAVTPSQLKELRSAYEPFRGYRQRR